LECAAFRRFRFNSRLRTDKSAGKAAHSKRFREFGCGLAAYDFAVSIVYLDENLVREPAVAIPAGFVITHIMLKQSLHELTVSTRGRGLYEITDEVADWISRQGFQNGLLTLHLRHTSARC